MKTKLIIALTLISVNAIADDSRLPTRSTIVFSRDLRPSDGDLVSITLAKQPDGRYAASLYEDHFDRIAKKEVSQTTSISANLKCEFTLDSDQVLIQMECTNDLRMVDGALTDLTIASDKSSGWYSASLRTVVRQNDSTQVIGSNLRLMP